jgi:hypothetical protein
MRQQTWARQEFRNNFSRRRLQRLQRLKHIRHKAKVQVQT